MRSVTNVEIYSVSYHVRRAIGGGGGSPNTYVYEEFDIVRTWKISGSERLRVTPGEHPLNPYHFDPDGSGFTVTDTQIKTPTGGSPTTTTTTFTYNPDDPAASLSAFETIHYDTIEFDGAGHAFSNNVEMTLSGLSILGQAINFPSWSSGALHDEAYVDPYGNPVPVLNADASLSVGGSGFTASAISDWLGYGPVVCGWHVTVTIALPCMARVELDLKDLLGTSITGKTVYAMLGTLAASGTLAGLSDATLGSSWFKGTTPVNHVLEIPLEVKSWDYGAEAGSVTASHTGTLAGSGSIERTPGPVRVCLDETEMLGKVTDTRATFLDGSFADIEPRVKPAIEPHPEFDVTAHELCKVQIEPSRAIAGMPGAISLTTSFVNYSPSSQSLFPYRYLKVDYVITSGSFGRFRIKIGGKEFYALVSSSSGTITIDLAKPYRIGGASPGTVSTLTKTRRYTADGVTPGAGGRCDGVGLTGSVSLAADAAADITFSNWRVEVVGDVLFRQTGWTGTVANVGAFLGDVSDPNAVPTCFHGHVDGLDAWRRHRPGGGDADDPGAMVPQQGLTVGSIDYSFGNASVYGGYMPWIGGYWSPSWQTLGSAPAGFLGVPSTSINSALWGPFSLCDSNGDLIPAGSATSTDISVRVSLYNLGYFPTYPGQSESLWDVTTADAVRVRCRAFWGDFYTASAVPAGVQPVKVDWTSGGSAQSASASTDSSGWLEQSWPTLSADYLPNTDPYGGAGVPGYYYNPDRSADKLKVSPATIRNAYWIGTVPKLAAGVSVGYDVSKAARHARSLQPDSDGILRVGFASNVPAWTDYATGEAATWSRVRYLEQRGGRLGVFYGDGVSATFARVVGESGGLTASVDMDDAIMGDFDVIPNSQLWFYKTVDTGGVYKIQTKHVDNAGNVVLGWTDTNISGIDSPSIACRSSFLVGAFRMGLHYSDGGTEYVKFSKDGITFA